MNSKKYSQTGTMYVYIITWAGFIKKVALALPAFASHVCWNDVLGLVEEK
jgi:hypothetical protein